MQDLKIPKRLTPFEQDVSAVYELCDFIRDEMLSHCDDCEYPRDGYLKILEHLRVETQRLFEAHENYDPRSKKERDRDARGDIEFDEQRDAALEAGPW